MDIFSDLSSSLFPKYLKRRHSNLFQLSNVGCLSLGKAVTKLRIEQHKFLEMSIVLHKVENIVIVDWIPKLSVTNLDDYRHCTQFSCCNQSFFEGISELNWFTETWNINFKTNTFVQ